MAGGVDYNGWCWDRVRGYSGPAAPTGARGCCRRAALVGHVTLSTSLLGVSPRKLANTSRFEAHAGLGAAGPR